MLWRKNLSRGLVALCSLIVLLSESYAGELIVHTGGSVTVKSGSVLLMNCEGLTVEDGGSFVVDGGEVSRRGRLTLNAGGTYRIESGKVDKCYKSYYVIPGIDGKGTVICL